MSLFFLKFFIDSFKQLSQRPVVAICPIFYGFLKIRPPNSMTIIIVLLYIYISVAKTLRLLGQRVLPSQYMWNSRFHMCGHVWPNTYSGHNNLYLIWFSRYLTFKFWWRHSDVITKIWNFSYGPIHAQTNKVSYVWSQ